MQDIKKHKFVSHKNSYNSAKCSGTLTSICYKVNSKNTILLNIYY